MKRKEDESGCEQDAGPRCELIRLYTDTGYKGKDGRLRVAKPQRTLQRLLGKENCRDVG